MGYIKKAHCTPEQWAAQMKKKFGYVKKADCTPEQWAAQQERKKARNEKRRERYQRNKEAHKAKAKERCQRNKEAYKAKAKEWLLRNPEYRERVRIHRRARNSGMTPDLFDLCMDLQGSRCAVCRRAFEGTIKPHADHDHTTGSPRGLLCHVCNTAEGLIKKTGLPPEAFARMLEAYLENPPADAAALI